MVMAFTPLATAASTLIRISVHSTTLSLYILRLWLGLLGRLLTPLRFPILLLLNCGTDTPCRREVIQQLDSRLIIISHDCWRRSDRHTLQDLKDCRSRFHISCEVPQNHPEVRRGHDLVSKGTRLLDALCQALEYQRCRLIKQIFLEG